MSDDRYDIVSFRGHKFDKLTRAALLAVEKELGYELTIVQGSYNSGVAASGGTHDGGGAGDLVPWDWNNKVRALRKHGFAAWHRPAIKGLWGEHIHFELIGDANATRAAKDQWDDYANHLNGLANNGRDTFGYHPTVRFQYDSGDEYDMASLDDLRQIIREEVSGDIYDNTGISGNHDANPEWGLRTLLQHIGLRLEQVYSTTDAAQNTWAYKNAALEGDKDTYQVLRDIRDEVNALAEKMGLDTVPAEPAPTPVPGAGGSPKA